MLQGCLQFWVLCKDKFHLWVVRLSKSIQLLLLPSFTAETQFSFHRWYLEDTSQCHAYLGNWQSLSLPKMWKGPTKAYATGLYCFSPFPQHYKTTVLILCTQRVHGQPHMPEMLFPYSLFVIHSLCPKAVFVLPDSAQLTGTLHLPPSHLALSNMFHIFPWNLAVPSLSLTGYSLSRSHINQLWSLNVFSSY